MQETTTYTLKRKVSGNKVARSTKLKATKQSTLKDTSRSTHKSYTTEASNEEKRESKKA